MRRINAIHRIFSKNDLSSAFVTCIAIFVFSGVFDTVQASETSENYVPERTGISLNFGYTYDPSEDIRFMQVSFFKLYDYDYIWKHSAPDNLRFKIEGAIGGASLKNDDIRVVANTGVLALLYLNGLESEFFIPYIEAGVGVIFTDFRVKGQDYRVNFNPQAGLGVEFKHSQAGNLFAAIRAHHISNGGIGSTNRGLNSVMLLIGRHF